MAIDVETSVVDAVVLTVFPSGLMLIMSLLVFVLTVPEKLVAALQHLAAGIVLSAVAVELIPILSASPNDAGSIGAIIVGFTLGIVLFLGVSKLSEAAEESEEEDSVGVTPTLKGDSVELVKDTPSSSTPATPAQNVVSPTGVTPMKSKLGQMCAANAFTLALDRIATNVPAEPSADIKYPFPLVIAVFVDAFVDGFLIGISSASGSNAGVVMTAALSIEMAFLGLTFATTMRKQPQVKAIITVIAPPAILIIGGVVGAAGAAALTEFPTVHLGLISFGIAALLYLVTEELLLEAHESSAEGGVEHVWYIDMMFFAGFLTSFLLEKVAEEER
eukprot:GFYU01025223.1.p1 GENE.GFYU01025223.1~~GFYU01025223.1.p1  ORF type:complete len:358 (+),score=86.48 GFYU01025223.1:80-1075(+)